MFTQEREYLSLRTLAIIPIVLFVPTMVLAVAMPDAHVGDGLGILFHIAVLFVVSRMPGPAWAKASGFGWLALDITSAAMTIHGVTHDIAFPVRLGGHVLAAVWLIGESLLNRSASVRVAGIFTGLWLAGFTFFGAGLSQNFLLPSSLSTVVFFGLIAWQSKPAPEPAVSADQSHPALV